MKDHPATTPRTIRPPPANGSPDQAVRAPRAEPAFGEPIRADEREWASLTKAIRSRKLSATQVDFQDDGDVRFWGVDAGSSPILKAFRDFAVREYEALLGRPPAACELMVNHISAQASPTGSGGGWHRDSFRSQYKALVYLTDVESIEHGPFCFVPGSKNGAWRLIGLLWRGATGENRYSDRAVRTLLRLTRSKGTVVLADRGRPFFTNTSLVHRGWPIKKGERIAATAYMYDDTGQLPDKFRPMTREGTRG